MFLKAVFFFPIEAFLFFRLYFYIENSFLLFFFWIFKKVKKCLFAFIFLFETLNLEKKRPKTTLYVKIQTKKTKHPHWKNKNEKQNLSNTNLLSFRWACISSVNNKCSLKCKRSKCTGQKCSNIFCGSIRVAEATILQKTEASGMCQSSSNVFF